MAEPVRLQRYLATAGVAARRKAEELITAGRVTVNGEVVTVLGTKVDPEHDAVEVDGEAVVALDRFYVLFNKPKGCITAVSDDRGRPTVMDYLPNLPVPVVPVGRLDFYSEGVLLLTNDGELAARLLAPASHVAKTYHVKVHGQVERDHIAALRDGVTLDDGTTTLPAEIEVLPGESKHTWLGITIHEGKHRQIHRMLEALGYRVDKLQRVAFANLTFHDLRVGDARELTQAELNELRDLVGLDHDPVARGRWRARREDTDIPRRARAKARAEAEAEAEAGEGPAAARAGTGGPRPATDDRAVGDRGRGEPRTWKGGPRSPTRGGPRSAMDERAPGDRTRRGGEARVGRSGPRSSMSARTEDRGRGGRAPRTSRDVPRSSTRGAPGSTTSERTARGWGRGGEPRTWRDPPRSPKRRGPGSTSERAAGDRGRGGEPRTWRDGPRSSTRGGPRPPTSGRAAGGQGQRGDDRASAGDRREPARRGFGPRVPRGGRKR